MPIQCMLPLLLVLLVLSTLPGTAQLLPSTSEVALYFPHFVTGGNPNDYWRTDFEFVNSNEADVACELYFQDDNGVLTEIDFNGGSESPYEFLIPAMGSASVRSTQPTQERSGWVDTYCDLPVQGIATFTRIRGGVPVTKVTAEPTRRTPLYRNLANRDVGLAISNPSDQAISVAVVALDKEGNDAGMKTFAVPAWGHIAFNLGVELPGLPNDFSGSVLVSAEEPKDWFVAWAVYDDGSRVNSSLPAGGFSRPVAHRELVWKIYALIYEAAKSYIGSDPVELSIPLGNEVNAFAANGNEVGITMGLAQLLGDSPDEIAFALAHEFGHIVQQRNGGSRTYNQNAERDADIWGTLIALEAGFGPYAMSGVLAKLSMVTGTAGFLPQSQQFFHGMAIADAHGSFNERIATVFDALTQACSSSAEVASQCAEYKRIFHPNLPPAAPLSRGSGDSSARATARAQKRVR